MFDPSYLFIFGYVSVRSLVTLFLTSRCNDFWVIPLSKVCISCWLTERGHEGLEISAREPQIMEQKHCFEMDHGLRSWCTVQQRSKVTGEDSVSSHRLLHTADAEAFLCSNQFALLLLSCNIVWQVALVTIDNAIDFSWSLFGKSSFCVLFWLNAVGEIDQLWNQMTTEDASLRPKRQLLHEQIPPFWSRYSQTRVIRGFPTRKAPPLVPSLAYCGQIEEWAGSRGKCPFTILVPCSTKNKKQQN